MKKILLKVMLFVTIFATTASFLSDAISIEAFYKDSLYENLDLSQCSSCAGFESEAVTDKELEEITEIVRNDYNDCDEIFSEKFLFYSSSSDIVYNHSSDYFYNQLDADGKALYNEFKTACEVFSNSSVNLSSQKMCEPINYNKNSMSLEKAINIYMAFYYSNPQYFFLKKGYSYNESQGTIIPKVTDTFMRSDNRVAYSNKLKAITAEWMEEFNSCSDIIAKEDLIIRKIAANTTYNTEAINNHSIAGALIDKECTCTGYTRTFNYFCNAAGIECIGVIGNNHSWNIIKINDIWYHVDVTAMDGDSGNSIYYKWFNKSHATFLSYDDSRNNHSIITSYYDGIFVLPECSADAPLAPKNIKASRTDNAITISWSAVDNATHYRLYRSENPDSVKELISTESGVSYTDVNLKNGKKYCYYLTSYNEKIKYESLVSAYVQIGIPVISGDYGYFYLNETDIDVTEFPRDERNIVIPSSIDGYKVTSISGNTNSFSFYPETVTIPNTVTTIGAYAFYGCFNIEYIIIPNRVTSIGSKAFYGCDISEITLPVSLKIIDDDAFYLCDTLTEVYYKGSESEWNGISIGANNEYLINANIHFNHKSKEEIQNVNNFVNRLYTIILGRDAEAEGLADWTNRLVSGTASSAEIVYGIANSQEFANRGFSNEEIVETMYQAMLGRASDEGGKADWLNCLNSGMTVTGIINGFSGSQEFAKICSDYGIQAGAITTCEARDRNNGLTLFVSRMYTKALNRPYDVAGLNDWTNRYLIGEAKVSDIAFGFIFSPEFVGKNLSNSDYVDTLYRTFFNREPDEGGKSDWMNKLANGMAREDVLNGFVGSQECINLVATFGI